MSCGCKDKQAQLNQGSAERQAAREARALTRKEAQDKFRAERQQRVIAQQRKPDALR